MIPSDTGWFRSKISVLRWSATTALPAVTGSVRVLRRLRCPGLNTRTRAAFSLLEILIALGILAGGLIAVLRSSHATLDAMTRSRGYLVAGLLLREQADRTVWALRAGSAPMISRSEAGRFPPPYAAYGWQQTVTPIDRLARLWSVETGIAVADGRVVLKNKVNVFVNN